jgi:predicted acyltransferase
VIGYYAGVYIKDKGINYETIAKLVLAGAAMLVIAYFWDLSFPINKKLWTSSYVLYAGSISMIFFALSIWLIDVKGWRKGIGFFLTFGANALFAYILSEALVISLYAVSWGEGETATNAKEWIYQTVFQSLAPTQLGSFLFSLVYMLVCWLVCRWLFVRKIFIKMSSKSFII